MSKPRIHVQSRGRRCAPARQLPARPAAPRTWSGSRNSPRSTAAWTATAPAAPHSPAAKGSSYGDGPRRPLDREQRARFRFLLGAHCRSGNLTDKGAKVGEALLKRLSADGRCDPSHDTLAADVCASTGKCCARTVRRALATMKRLGLLLWQQRIVRVGPSVSQTSNAYALIPAASAPAFVSNKKEETLKASPFAGQVVHRSIPAESPAPDLARIAAARMASGALRLGRCPAVSAGWS
jgi:hypothetical protein